METAQLVLLTQEALKLMVLASAPPLLASLLLGVLASVGQAATQVQDSTLSVVPKLCATALALTLMGPTLADQLLRFSRALFALLPQVTS